MRADVDKAMFVEEKQTSLPEMKSTTSKCLALKQTADKEAFQLDKIITKKKSGFRKNRVIVAGRLYIEVCQFSSNLHFF